MKLPKADKLLNDKKVLYVVFVLAILNVLGYLVMQNTEAVAFFLIVGFLCTYFSKNMIIVLMIAIVSTSLFASTRTVSLIKEGMSNNRRTQKKSSKTDTVKPDSDTDPIEEMTPMQNNKNRVDYAGTLSEAYNNLQKSVGKGGIKGLTDQTETLLNQQKELMDNITGMQPLLKTAESFMSKLNLDGLEGITGMLTKYGGGDKKQ